MMSMPSFVELELTNHCQLDCIMCPHGKMTRPKGFMDFDLLKKIIDQVKGHVRDSYLHVQGEPLLHPRLIDCINYVADAGIKTSLATNMMAMDKKMANKLLDSKLNEMLLSIDSLDKETYEKIRVGANFDTVINNLRYLLDEKKRRGSNLQAMVVLTKMKENEKDWDTFKMEGATEVWTKRYSTFAGYATKGETPPSPKPGCNKTQTHLTVLWNGDVVCCCRDFDGFSKYGNLNTELVESVWNRRETDVNKIDFCRNC